MRSAHSIRAGVPAQCSPCSPWRATCRPSPVAAGAGGHLARGGCRPQGDLPHLRTESESRFCIAKLMNRNMSVLGASVTSTEASYASSHPAERCRLATGGIVHNINMLCTHHFVLFLLVIRVRLRRQRINVPHLVKICRACRGAALPGRPAALRPASCDEPIRLCGGHAPEPGRDEVRPRGREPPARRLAGPVTRRECGPSTGSLLRRRPSPGRRSTCVRAY